MEKIKLFLIAVLMFISAAFTPTVFISASKSKFLHTPPPPLPPASTSTPTSTSTSTNNQTPAASKTSTITIPSTDTPEPLTENSDEAALSDDATLKDLTVNESSVTGFFPDQFVYVILLPKDTVDIPVVDAVTNDDKSNTVIIQAKEIAPIGTYIGRENQSLVKVTAEDGREEDYAVIFYTEPNIDKLQNIAQTKPQPSAISPQSQQKPFCYNFNYNFGEGSKGADIQALHNILKKEGFSYKHDNDDSYGYGTEKGVGDFQKIYMQDYLNSISLPNGTGYVGSATREILNSLYGCIE